MSMKMLTILQIAGILAAYLSVTMAAPWVLLRKKFSGLKLSVRLMAYFMCGNFYVMNLVYLLQLLHISYRPTLIIGTLFPFAAAVIIRLRKSFTLTLEQGTRRIRVISEGEMGIKTQLHRVWHKVQELSSGLLGEWMAPRWVDIILTLGIVGLVFYMYGSGAISVYGYQASDIVVHNSWINELGKNNIFSSGVYPYGFHNVIYYLHEVFVIPTYVLLRVFCVVQTLMIHLMLLFFLRSVCKAKYTPYIGTFIFTASDFFNVYAYGRYSSSLPQEFGMLFILPSVYFAIAFFQEKGNVSAVGGEGKKKIELNFSLIMFAVSVSMTLAVHFYDSIITAVFCVGLAIGFCFRCFRWRYLKRIVLAGVVGILLAVIPMGTAYMMGTRLQGSLYWGMSILSPAEKGNSEEEESNSSELVVDERVSFQKKLNSAVERFRLYVTKADIETVKLILGSTGVLFLLGIVWCILKKGEYGGILISVSIYMLILLLLHGASDFGFPQLLEISRYSIYVAYGFGLVCGLGADALLFLLFQEKKSIHRSSMVTLGTVCMVMALSGKIRVPSWGTNGQETNDAVTCLTNIIRENYGGGTWTICSANDERQMALDYGNHYELIDFLREMEDVGIDTSVTVPTKTVYFFVEKVPLFSGRENSGRRVSQEGARKTLPAGRALTIYEGDSRWVVMSRLYYWAQAFQRLYPNEMEVYYETDDFVCYRVKQNEYSLYNFAIDYGYN